MTTQAVNPVFNSPEFEKIKNEAGLNRFTLTVKKWIEKTNAVGLLAKTGRYGGGTYAHKNIAFEFGSWLSPVDNQKVREIKPHKLKLLENRLERNDGEIKAIFNAIRSS